MAKLNSPQSFGINSNKDHNPLIEILAHCQIISAIDGNTKNITPANKHSGTVTYDITGTAKKLTNTLNQDN